MRLAFVCVVTAGGFLVVASNAFTDTMPPGGSDLALTLYVTLRLLLVVAAAATGFGAIAEAVLAVFDEGERSLLLAVPAVTGALVSIAMIARMLFA